MGKRGKMVGAAGLIAVVVSGISFVICVIGTAIPYWIYASVGSAWQSEGLWQVCGTSSLGGSACASFVSVFDWVKAVRAMEILGILLIGGAGLCGFLKLFAMKDMNVLPKLAAAIAILAGIFMLIGIAIYGAKFSNINPTGSLLHLFAGFGLCIVSGILAIVAGVIFAIADNKKQI